MINNINWQDVFSYVDGAIYWKVSSGRVKAGTLAGTAHSRGYLTVQYLGKRYFVHRIVWVLHKGSIPEGMQIDHLNGDCTDNRIDNLRCVTQLVNNHNQAQYANNSTGVNGVSWNKRAGKYLVQIQVDGKRQHLGYFDSIEKAQSAREEAQADHDFTERHGKVKYPSSEYYNSHCMQYYRHNLKTKGIFGKTN